MFLIRIQNYQTVTLLLMAGLVIVISMALGYIGIWRLRDEKSESDEGDTEWLPFWRSVSWFLIFTNLAIIGLGIAYTIYRILEPPIW